MVEVPGISGYSEVASRFCELSESIDFREIHRCILHLLPGAGAVVLDVGAGTGRDAAALAALGHNVVAVEPMAQFLAGARAKHRSSKIRWVSGSLPGLHELPAEPDQFDFVLCHAVWQHLNTSERAEAIARVATLLKPKGVFALGLRHGRPGAGTRYFPASVAETVRLAATVSLVVELRLEDQSSALPNKTHVTWTRLAFRKTTYLAQRSAV
jgi:SAM-dependent methyltransferase